MWAVLLSIAVIEIATAEWYLLSNAWNHIISLIIKNRYTRSTWIVFSLSFSLKMQVHPLQKPAELRKEFNKCETWDSETLGGSINRSSESTNHIF